MSVSIVFKQKNVITFRTDFQKKKKNGYGGIVNGYEDESTKNKLYYSTLYAYAYRVQLVQLNYLW